MKKDGFTLVELLAVIIVIGLIVSFALPRVLNQFSNAQGGISENQKDLIIEATRLYVDENKGSYSTSQIYCIPLSDLVDSGHLNEGFVNNSNLTGYKSKVDYNGSRYQITVVQTCP